MIFARQIHPRSASHDLKLNVLDLWQTNFASYNESTGSPVQDLFVNCRFYCEIFNLCEVPNWTAIIVRDLTMYVIRLLTIKKNLIVNFVMIND